MEDVLQRRLEEEHLVINSLSKNYPGRGREVQALEKVFLRVNRHEFVSIVGSSGCGKSTLLRIIAGLEKDFQGSVTVKGKKIEGAGLDRGMVFQEPRLLPWLTVERNLEFALQEGDSRKKSECIAAYLDMTGLAEFGRAFPGELSGGMAQRVSIARALINRPEILLLDEPFGALDALTRLKMQKELLKIWEKENTTMIMVTHDIEEAIFLGDRVVVMSDRPGTVSREYAVNLPRPRRRSGNEFMKLRKEICREFHEDLV